MYHVLCVCVCVILKIHTSLHIIVILTIKWTAAFDFKLIALSPFWWLLVAFSSLYWTWWIVVCIISFHHHTLQKGARGTIQFFQLHQIQWNLAHIKALALLYSPNQLCRATKQQNLSKHPSKKEVVLCKDASKSSLETTLEKQPVRRRRKKEMQFWGTTNSIE